MWCCNTFWEKWVTLRSYSWTAKMFYWWTVSLCLIAGRRRKKKHVTAAGLCLSLYLATLEAKRGSLYFLGYCLLVALFYQLFMKKCERDILTEIKKEHIMKATLRLSAVRSCRVVVNAACKAMDICLYQTGGSHLNLTPRRHLSVLAACVCASAWVSACVRRILGGGGEGTHCWQRAAGWRRGCGSCTFSAHLELVRGCFNVDPGLEGAKGGRRSSGGADWRMGNWGHCVTVKNGGV